MFLQIFKRMMNFIKIVGLNLNLKIIYNISNEINDYLYMFNSEELWLTMNFTISMISIQETE